MTETKYEKEDVLQTYLQDYPDLLAGDQIDPENPRRWLLIAREMSVPGDTDQIGRWSLDHLFLDQDGIPTFVECKRSSDTRARREVVAQMLDYAANGLEYWSIDKLRQAATETASQGGKSISDEISELIDSQDEFEIEDYWKVVERNLREGKVRLVFVADETPKELRRLVEFMNAKMTDVEVLAVEIKQFIGESTTALVPRLIGQTEESRNRKGEGVRTPRKKTTEDEFLENCTDPAKEIFMEILRRAKAEKHKIYWGDRGFSIRAPAPNSDKFFTYVYGFPKDLLKISTGLFPISEQEKLSIRTEMKDLGFSDAGYESVRMTLGDKTQGNAIKAFDLALEKVKRVVQAGM
jgi:phosphosulfolactate synthase (CoM biosynthesis protein A)